MPEIQMFDTVTLHDRNVTGEGFIAGRVRFARTGVQAYRGREVGMPDVPLVRVYRPPEEVFHPDSMASFVLKPVTNGHPPEMVTPANWRKYAVGAVGEKIGRDGEHLDGFIVISDAKAIADVDAGRKELSAGYTATISLEGGTTAQGETYDAVQRGIRGNHIALVDAGRCGGSCRIGDVDFTDCGDCDPASCNCNKGKTEHMTTPTPTVTLKTIVVDGLPFPVNDAAEAIINKLQAQLADANAKLSAATVEAGKAAAEIAARDGKISALEQAVKDAAITPEKMDAAVTARAAIVDSARKLAPGLNPAGKTDAVIKREAVAVKMGDAAVKDKPDEYVAATFDTLVSLAGTDAAGASADPLRNAAPVAVGDAAKALNDARAAHLASLTDSWKTPQAAAK